MCSTKENISHEGSFSFRVRGDLEQSVMEETEEMKVTSSLMQMFKRSLDYRFAMNLEGNFNTK